jgi:phenylalanyl-tRNA synthetase beta chain
MNISYRWLLSLLPGFDAPPEHVAELLARYGAPPEAIRDVAAELRDIVIGRVIEARRHPNADRLTLCHVDTGNAAPLSVVCGAPNVVEGAFYPFAPVGATLPGGATIRKAKIRGEESQGMLCSARELGLGREHEGILELRGEFQAGVRFAEAMGLDDVVFTIDVTPNRPDLLAHIGVARELAPDAGVRVSLPPLPNARVEAPLTMEHGPRSIGGDGVRITIEDATGCPRYLGAIVRGVTIGASPAWLEARLRAIGVRPINTVVDATNYVLHELGQPLHAFDLARLGETVVIRRAAAGETIRTLDGVDRTLAEGTLVIADAERPVALAGVMGGEETEVTADTRDIFLECALFDPAAVRASRRSVDLSTDASYRFERGVDPDGLERALRRCVELIASIAGGTAPRSALGVGVTPAASPRLRLRPARVAQVLGIDVPADRIAALLGGIGFPAERVGDGLTVTVPGYRSRDVQREDDLVEEVARRHGYDAIPEDLRPFRPSAVPDDPLFGVEDALRERLVGLGLLEARATPFAPANEGEVALLLPLAATESRLRRTLLRGLVRRLEYNFARGARDVRLFEIGTAFRAGEDDAAAIEGTRLAVICTGGRAPLHWSGPAGDFEVWDVKAIAEEIAAFLGARLSLAPLAESVESALFAPGARFALVDAASPGDVIGWAGRLADGIVDAPAWAAPAFGLEVVLRAEPLPGETSFRALPAYPAVERDLALLVPRGVAAELVEQTIRDAAGAWLENIVVFDLYAGEGVPPGVRSIGFRLLFRAADRTLTDADVDAQIDRILRRLKEAHGIGRR